MTEKKRLAIPDIFRALAALLIFLFHSLLFGEHGYMGVEILMVLCGFTAMLSTADEEKCSRFLIKKIVRIVPLYWALTLFMFVLIRIRPSLSLMSTASLPDLIRSLLFIPFVNEKGFRAPVFSLGWMLEYQMLFFILFTLALRAAKKIGRFRLRGVTAGIFLILFMAAAKDTFPLEFIYGIGIYYLYEYVDRTDIIKKRTGRQAKSRSGKSFPSQPGQSGLPLLPVLLGLLFFCACILAECVTQIPRQYLLGILTSLMIAFPLLMTGPIPLPPMVSRLAECSYEFILIEYFTTAFFKVISAGMPFPARLAVLAVILGITFGASVIVHRLYGIFLVQLRKRIKTDQE